MNFSKKYEILPKAALASLVEDNSGICNEWLID